MLMFEAHIRTREWLDECELARRAYDGDELALCRTHRDASALLSRLLAFIHLGLPAAARILVLPAA